MNSATSSEDDTEFEQLELVPSSVIMQMVREIALDQKIDIDYVDQDALALLQYEADEYMLKVFEASGTYTTAAHRVTMLPKDIREGLVKLAVQRRQRSVS